MKNYHGYTLIQIVITLAIIAILAGLAIPAYQSYVVRTDIAEGLVFADAARIDIEEQFSVRGVIPDSGPLMVAKVDMIDQLNWYKDTQKTDQGYIDVKMNLPHFKNAVTPFLLVAEHRAGVLQWRCVSARAQGYADKDSVANKYLPSVCLDARKMKQAVSSNSCHSNEDQVIVKGTSVCTPKCKIGELRSTSNPTQCISQPVSVTTTSTGSAGNVLSTQSVTPPPVSSQPSISCSSKKESVVVKGVPTCLDKCSSGTVRDSSDPSQCVRKYFTASVDPRKQNPCPAGQVFMPKGSDVSPWDGLSLLGSCYGNGGKVDPYEETQCNVCAGPPEACELAYYSDSCKYPTNYCLNHITNLADGNRLVERKCATVKEVYNNWYLGSSDDDKCRQLNGNSVLTYRFECSYGCVTDDCNADIHPTTGLWLDI